MILKRDFYTYLLNWKHQQNRKPILLQGARQVGKTFLLKYFAQNEFSNFVYLNLEENKELFQSLENIQNAKSLLEYLSIYTKKNINLKETLIIFDEVQTVPQIITSLKYFYENFPNSYVIATGSLLGISLFDNANGTFPVGKIDMQYLYPLSFFEFLNSFNETSLLDLLLKKQNFNPIPEVFHKELVKYLKLYFLIGGMPESVVTYLESQFDWNAVRKIQTDILNAYLIDSLRYSMKSETMKIREVWSSIPQQISKENKRFKISEIKKNASLRNYRTALDWLINAGLIHKIDKIKTIKLPLSAYKDTYLFKIFFFDIGLLSALLDLSPQTVLKQNELFLLYKGFFTENYIAQELITNHTKNLYYWAENTSEIDFILSYKGNIVPIEIKSGFNTKAKSFKVYINKYNPKYTIRSSLLNFNKTKNIYDIPLYSIALFPKFLNTKI